MVLDISSDYTRSFIETHMFKAIHKLNRTIEPNDWPVSAVSFGRLPGGSHVMTFMLEPKYHKLLQRILDDLNGPGVILVTGHAKPPALIDRIRLPLSEPVIVTQLPGRSLVENPVSPW